MGNVYCTLFDTHYLPRGLMMLRSLSRVGAVNDKIYVFCFDEHTYQVLRRLRLEKVIPVSLAEFETPELLKVKPSRTKGEYCWTCTAHTILHVIDKRGEKECTYLDADLYFYQNPGFVIPDSKEGSVLITEHRYTPKDDQTRTSGRFCVQFVTFKNEANSMNLLHLWGKQCLEWCFNRVEDGKFGDQKYLDVWPEHGAWVRIAEHPGVGMAPWNIQQYSETQVDPVFFHFHGVTRYPNELFDLGPYQLDPWVLKRFYESYVREWVGTSAELASKFNTEPAISPFPRNRFKYWLRRWIFSSSFIRV